MGALAELLKCRDVYDADVGTPTAAYVEEKLRVLRGGTVPKDVANFVSEDAVDYLRLPEKMVLYPLPPPYLAPDEMPLQQQHLAQHLPKKMALYPLHPSQPVSDGMAWQQRLAYDLLEKMAQNRRISL